VQNLGCVVAMLSLFMLVGAGMAAVQVDRLLVWRPVQATVISSQVIAVRGSKGGTNYRPAVTYSYQVGGRTYTSQSVTIINESRGWSWATGIVARYPAGAQITAYVNPRDPAGAYLVHALSVFPFVFVLIPLLFTGLVLLSARWNARQAALAAAAPVPVLAAQSLAPSKAA